MKRFRRFLALSTLLLLACTDSDPTATDDAALVSDLEDPCPACSFGPRRFWQHNDPSPVTFVPAPGLTGSCTLGARDDGRPATRARIWFNGVEVVAPGALLGPTAVVRVPVTVARDSNMITVVVRGGRGHFVTVRIVCHEPLDIVPDTVSRVTGAAQQFSVSGVPGPYTWSVNGRDGGDATFGTVDGSGLYLAPAAVPTPSSFPVCARVTASPEVTVCATVTIDPGPTARMVIVSGDNQVAAPGSALPIPPAVLVTRADGSPWAGMVVTFTVTGGGGTVTGATPTTGIDGIATVGSWTLGAAPGSNALTATAADSGIQGSPVTFTAAGLGPHPMAAGGFHACGIASGGATYCWGLNNLGQLGDGTYLARHEPTPVLGAPPFVTLTAGLYFTCGLTADGTAYCWGSNGATTYFGPGQVGGALRFTSLSASHSYSTCGLATDGTAYCWGNNYHGQLGDGTTTQRREPTPVTGGLTFTTLVAGYDHSCGLTQAGELYCWGSNEWGQLGDSTMTDRLVPTRVATTLRFAKLTLGKLHTCALTPLGEAYCWGTGEMGDGTSGTRPAPVKVLGGLTFTTLTTGAIHTCGLTTTGAAYCWGQGTKGQLGLGTLPNWVYVPKPVAGGLTFHDIVGGWEFTSAITIDGVAYAWGENSDGQLGDGGTSNRISPTPVAGGLQFLGGAP